MRSLGRLAVPIGVLWGLPIAARSLAARQAAERTPGHSVNLEATPDVVAVDGRLWRGPAPGDGGYAELAKAGVTLIVDLRAEIDPDALPIQAEAGLELLHLPIGNGRPSGPHDVTRFATAMEATSGITYVHCQAGEGRTGTIVGAYEVLNGKNAWDSVADGLAVGSLTFSQIVCIVSAGRWTGFARAVDWVVDRPTEVFFDLGRRRSHGAD